MTGSKAGVERNPIITNEDIEKAIELIQQNKIKCIVLRNNLISLRRQFYFFKLPIETLRLITLIFKVFCN